MRINGHCSSVWADLFWDATGSKPVKLENSFLSWAFDFAAVFHVTFGLGNAFLMSLTLHWVIAVLSLKSWAARMFVKDP